MENIEQTLNEIKEYISLPSIQVINSFIDIKDEQSMEGTIVFNRNTLKYYGHDGGSWTSISNILNENEVKIGPDYNAIEFVFNENDIQIESNMTQNKIIFSSNGVQIDTCTLYVNKLETNIIELEGNDCPPNIDKRNCIWYDKKNKSIMHSYRLNGEIHHRAINNYKNIYHIINNKECYINFDAEKPIFFEDIYAWDVRTQYCSLYEFYNDKSCLFTLDKQNTSSTYGFIGMNNMALKKGLYKIRFTTFIKKPMQMEIEENIPVFYNVLSYDRIQKKIQIEYTINNIPNEFVDEFYFTSDGNKWIGFNLSNNIGMHSIKHASILIEQIIE